MTLNETGHSMTDEEKISALRKMTDDPTGEYVSDEVLLLYLTAAGSSIIAKAYPYQDDITEVPLKYVPVQLEIAAYLVNKRGAEGETAHSENGISRSYEGAEAPASMLRGITPMCGVMS